MFLRLRTLGLNDKMKCMQTVVQDGSAMEV